MSSDVFQTFFKKYKSNLYFIYKLNIFNMEQTFEEVAEQCGRPNKKIKK